MIKLSILIPSYNHAKFIRSTLDSHVEDNFFDYEIIVIDDGSSDNSVQLIDDWINLNPSVNITFIKRENRGVTATFNQLINLARGQYLRLFGSDDISFPFSSRDMVNFLEETGDDAVFGYARVIDSEGHEVSDNSIEFLNRKVKDYQLNLSESVIRKWAIVGPSLVLKKSVFEKIGLFDEKSLIEDWYLYLNLVSRFKISFLNSPVAFYRIHSQNTSRTNNPEKRVRNYESQISSGKNCLNFFSGYDKVALESEISLLVSKKRFVQGDYLGSFFYLIKFFIQFIKFKGMKLA